MLYPAMKSMEISAYKRIAYSFMVAACGILLLLLGGEIMLRTLFKERFELSRYFDERNLSYRHDPELGWMPRKNASGYFWGSRKFFYVNNSLGFRDQEHGSKEKVRIAFLGDSFVWGYDVDNNERFTDKLDRKLPDHRVINLGVSGYGTDQAFLLLKKYYDLFMPDIVFVIFNNMDMSDNSSNIVHGGYYKPYIVFNKDDIEVKGVPVPMSVYYYYAKYYRLVRHSYLVRGLLHLYAKYFLPPRVNVPDPTHGLLLSMKSFVESNGADFVVGIVDYNPPMEHFLEQTGISYVSLETSLRYPSHGYHWTPEGHGFVSNKVLEFLIQEGHVNFMDDE